MKAANGTKPGPCGRLARERKIANAIRTAKDVSGHTERGKAAKSAAKRGNSSAIPRPISLECLKAEVRRLTALSSLEYESCREATAKRLGIRVATLDHEVESGRAALKASSEPAFLAETEPHPEPVDGGELLHDIAGFVRRFVVLDDNDAIAVALWVAFAHAHDAATYSPILAVESPEKRCGKSTLLSVLASLVPKPLPSANITMAPLFRAVEKYGPTLLIDEADTFIKNSDELRGILNSGHYRPMAMVMRTVGDDYEPKPFSTWASKVIALIGELPDTLQDRAIVLRLRRKLSSEHVERFRGEALAECQVLNAKLARWTQDQVAAIKHRDPEAPSGLNDRAADNWSLLLAIADEAGGDWPAMARAAALTLSGDDADEGGASVATKLLADIRSVFDEANVGSMPSHSLAEKLAEREDAPWGEWFHGKPITPRAVARLLKRFDIKPRKERASNVYWCQDFEDAWGRYLDEPDIQVPQVPTD